MSQSAPRIAREQAAAGPPPARGHGDAEVPGIVVGVRADRIDESAHIVSDRLGQRIAGLGAEKLEQASDVATMEADVRDDVAAGRLVSVLNDWAPTLAPLCLYYPNRRHSSAAFQAFIALAREFAVAEAK